MKKEKEFSEDTIFLSFIVGKFNCFIYQTNPKKIENTQYYGEITKNNWSYLKENKAFYFDDEASCNAWIKLIVKARKKYEKKIKKYTTEGFFC